MNKKSSIMISLKPKLQREIFKRLIEKDGGSIKASKKLKIPATSIRSYKNLYFKSVPKSLLKKLVTIKITSLNELNKNTLSIFNKEELIKKNLTKGREKRREKLSLLKANIPSLKEIMTSNHLDILKWFEKYKPLVESGFRKLKVINKKRYILIQYQNYAKGNFKIFKVKLPNKIKLNHEFIYFFGLWCGDRSGGKRLGVSNKNKEIIDFTQYFLKKNYQNVERVLYITKRQSKPQIKYDKKFILDHEKKGWVLSVHSNNGIFSSFFYYLQSNLSEFLLKIPRKNAFFAGLFDAEGNVSLYNKSFRWACKNEVFINIYSKFLKELSLYQKYDGSCLVSYNKKEFYNKILPYLRHKDKINKTLFLCKGEGKLTSEYLNILKYIKNNPEKTQKSISKDLKKSKVYAELSLLNDFNFINHKDYPYKFKITKKGLNALGGK